MSEQAESTNTVQSWLPRARFLLALALVWGSLHYVCQASVLPRGMDRALVVTGAAGWFLAPVVTGALLLVLAYVGAIVAGGRRSGVAPLIVALGLACWSLPAGTMDDWLKLKITTLDASAAAAYWPLIGEYLFLLVCMIGAMILGELAGLGGAVSDPAKRKSAVRRALGLDLSATEVRNGLLAMVLTAVIAGVLMLYLTGPRVAPTRRGQVYFAVAAAFLIGVLIASKVVTARHPLWYALAPFLVGITGLILAGIDPTLPEPYAKINIIPASGLVRPLPIEMVGVATVAVIWALRPAVPTGAASN